MGVGSGEGNDPQELEGQLGHAAWQALQLPESPQQGWAPLL